MKAPRQAVLRAINAGLARVGLELRRRPARTHHYPQVDSCQIANLDFLYSHFLGRREDGFFVEVGAYDGYSFSNTWGLAERGWAGLLIEPVPQFAVACEARHRGHPKVKTLNLAMGDTPGGELRVSLAGTLSTANPDQLAEYAKTDWSRGVLTRESISVRSSTLDATLAAHDAPREFDVLVVDVEGFEQKVFGGFTLAEWRPKMVIVELADTHPDLAVTRAGDHRLGQHVIGCGYGVVYKDEINTVFVRTDVIGAAYRA